MPVLWSRGKAERTTPVSGLPILGLLALVSWAYWRSQARARRYQVKGVCALCGSAPATMIVHDLEQSLHVCEKCASATGRSHAAVYYAFIVMAVILGLIFCGFVVDSLSGGASGDGRFLLTFGLIVAGNVVLVLRMRAARRKGTYRRDAAQQGDAADEAGLRTEPRR